MWTRSWVCGEFHLLPCIQEKQIWKRTRKHKLTDRQTNNQTNRQTNSRRLGQPGCLMPSAADSRQRHRFTRAKVSKNRQRITVTVTAISNVDCSLTFARWRHEHLFQRCCGDRSVYWMAVGKLCILCRDCSRQNKWIITGGSSLTDYKFTQKLNS